MRDARDEVFLAARAYFAAASRYWSAAQCGGDMETPTQELLGQSLYYGTALKNCPGEFAQARLRYLRRQLQVVTERYAGRR